MTDPPVVLTETEVRAMLPIGDAVPVVRGALVAHAAGAVTQPGRWRLRTSRTRVDVTGAHVHGGEHFTARLATPASGLSVVGDADGRPSVIVLDDGYLGDVRTAAAGALAADALARPGAATVALIGTGPLAELHLEALLTLRAPSELRVAPAAAGPPDAAFASRMRALHGWTVTHADAPADAVRGADIVVTHAPAPSVHGEWLAPGAHVTCLGPDGHRALTASVLEAAALVAADDLPRSRHLRDLGHPADLRLVLLGDVLTGRSRAPRDRTTVADLTGLGAADAALGARVALITRAITGAVLPSA